MTTTLTNAYKAWANSLNNNTDETTAEIRHTLYTHIANSKQVRDAIAINTLATRSTVTSITTLAKNDSASDQLANTILTDARANMNDQRRARITLATRIIGQTISEAVDTHQPADAIMHLMSMEAFFAWVQGNITLAQDMLSLIFSNEQCKPYNRLALVVALALQKNASFVTR